MVCVCVCVFVYLGDEDAVLLKQVVVVVATGQQLPDFRSEWLGNAAANQRGQTLGTSGQVPVPDTEHAEGNPLFYYLT